MKLRFLIDTENPFRWGDDGDDCADERSTNSWVNSRHHHEYQSIKELLYNDYRKYCDGTGHNKFVRTELIELPDEVMFQYMMDGIEDEDYLVYNPFTERLVLSNNISDACELAYRDRTSNSSHGRAIGGYKNSASGTSLILDWSNDSRTAFVKDEIITREVQDDFYNLVWSAVKPYFQHWFTKSFIHAASTLYSDQNKKYQEVYAVLRNEPYGMEEAVPCDNYKTRLPFNIDALVFIFNQYCDDGEFFLEGKKYFDHNNLETFRLIYMICHRKSTENWDE